MFMQHSTTADATPHVEVAPPHSLGDGTVVGPDVQLWPFGENQFDHYWSMSLDEAEDLAAKLTAKVSEARLLFPT